MSIIKENAIIQLRDQGLLIREKQKKLVSKVYPICTDIIYGLIFLSLILFFFIDWYYVIGTLIFEIILLFCFKVWIEIKQRKLVEADGLCHGFCKRLYDEKNDTDEESILYTYNFIRTEIKKDLGNKLLLMTDLNEMS